MLAPAIARRGFITGSSEAKARDLVQGRLELSARRYGGQNDVFRQLNRYYLSLSPKLRAHDNDRAKVIRASKYPDLFVSRSFTSIEAATPAWIFGVCAGNPPVRVFARNRAEEAQADAVQTMITYDWERSRVLERSMHVAKQMFKYGTGVAKIGYRFDEYEIDRRYERTIPRGFSQNGKLLTRTDRFKKSETVKRFDGPWLEPWSIYNWHPDPYYNHMSDLRYVCARRWTDRKTLDYENENHYRFTGRPLYKHLDRIPTVKGNYIESIYQMDHGDDLSEAMGWKGGFSLGRSSRHGGIWGKGGEEQDSLIEIVECWDRDDKVVYLANGEVPILDSENPFDDKEIPFVMARCHVLDNELMGYGYLHPIKRSQEELNSHRNLFMRQGQLNVMNLWGYDEGMGLPPTLDGEVEPGSFHGIHFASNGTPLLVPLINGRPLPPEAYEIEDRIDRDIQTTLALPQYGVQPSKAETATAASLAAANIEQRNRLMTLGGEITYATEIARFFHSRRQQYLQDEGEVFRIMGDTGQEYKFMTPGDIAGQYDFAVAGTNLNASKDVLRQQLLQLWSLIKGDPVMMEMTNLYELWEETFKMFDFNVPKRFLSPPQERTYDAPQEDKVMLTGEPVVVETRDDHEAHLESHRMAFQKAVSSGNMAAVKAVKDHIKRHEQMLKQQMQQAPPQEQPGIKGSQGAVPNLENAAPSLASINAGIGGAGAQV